MLALLSRGVDALALTGISQHAGLMTRLAQRGLPWVHTGSFPAPAGAACVGFRNREAIARAVRYLLDLGHRRIAMLAGIAADNDRVSERIDGVREALAAARLKLPSRALVQSPYNLAAAREGTRALLAATPAPTALLCGNDVLAWGALLECQSQGVEVPTRPVDHRLRRPGNVTPLATGVDHRACADRTDVDAGGRVPAGAARR